MARAQEAGNPQKRKTRILVVDDHPMVRERLAEVINAERDLCVCGEAQNHSRALEAVVTARPDLVLVDLNLNGSDGFDLIKDLRVRHPKLLMLVVSMHDELLYAERALRAGAHGYITKQNATSQILVAIRKVLAGDVYMSDTLASQIASKITGHRPRTTPTPDRLSDRELSVFELIGQGCRMCEIAERLHLDVKTVETYRVRIKEKLALADANEVLKHAIRWSRNVSRS